MRTLQIAREHQVPRFDLVRSDLVNSCASPLDLRDDCHADDGHLEGRALSALVRRSLVAGREELQIVRADEVVDGCDQFVRVWSVLADVLSAAKAFGGYSRDEVARVESATALLGYQPLLITDSVEFPSFLVLRDSSTCVTLAGPDELVCRFVAQASVLCDFFEGIPKGGFSYGIGRLRFNPGMSRSEALKRDREVLRRIRGRRSLH